ncbi:MAG: DUF3482 domain-containing protein [Desulfobacteraceae bacterium]|nr:DUF3482 domain-containing protein [Desulfobacteraceae bacterium]MBU4002036.1 GTPase/DUF3482 domain-containing protein [Pseudomonadota bacterium]
MRVKSKIPVFAVLGHPNEGKSSVVSTLSEDDRVRITPVPGETVVCHPYPVVIDGEEIIRFVDTPGFQAPKKTLAWFKAHEETTDNIVGLFRKFCLRNQDFQDEVELLGPVEMGAGIIYVLDGSRPLRSDDKAEMEILRMTGQPRMAVINNKDASEGYIEDWKKELRKHFNVVRIFNAHRATYRERIDLLESLRAIDPDWQGPLEKVITAFKQDWQRRNTRTAELILEMLEKCIRYKIVKKFQDEDHLESARKAMEADYGGKIAGLEKETHQRIKKRFKHNIFQMELPPDDMVNQSLFNERTWQVLGLKPGQLAIAAGVAGGIMGSILDVAAHGLTFGIFTALGGLAAAGSALLGGSKMTNLKIKGIRIGGFRIQTGPMENPQFMFVLIDRALLLYARIINWAHGRRGLPDSKAEIQDPAPIKMGYTSLWEDRERRACFRLFKMIRTGTFESGSSEKQAFLDLILTTLEKISRNAYQDT